MNLTTTTGGSDFVSRCRFRRCCSAVRFAEGREGERPMRMAFSLTNVRWG